MFCAELNLNQLVELVPDELAMALDVFTSVRYLLKPEEICIDNWIFKLHYRITVLFLLASSAIGVSKQYFGDPINCQVYSLGGLYFGLFPAYMGRGCFRVVRPPPNCKIWLGPP